MNTEIRNYIICISVTVILTILSSVVIRYGSIKSQTELKQRLLALISGSSKLNICLALMFMVNIAVILSLFFIYKEDVSVLFCLKRALLLTLLWPAAYYDYKSFRIPNKLIVIGLIYRCVILIFEFIFEKENIPGILRSEIVAVTSLFAVSFLCRVIAKNSLGMGDIKLFIIIGLMLGINGSLAAIFCSLIVSFILAVVLLITKKKTRKDSIPFAPSLLIGTVISVVLTGV